MRRVLAGGVLVGGLVLAFVFAGITVQENALAREIDGLGVQIAAEQARNASLAQAAAEKRTKDYVIEKAKQYGWVWPWEAIIAVQRDNAAKTDAAKSADRTSHVARWIALFVGR